MFADIYINIPVKSIAQAFTYKVPEEFNWLQAGTRAIVPFGPKLIEGFVTSVYDNLPDNIPANKLRPIKDVLDSEPWFTPKMYETAKWMSDYYLCSLGETMRLFIPGKNTVKFSPVYEINSAIEDLEKLHSRMSDEENRLYNYIAENPGKNLRELRKALPQIHDVCDVAKKLVYRNILQTTELYAKTANNLYQRYITLEGELAEDIQLQLKRTPAQLKALMILNELPNRELSFKDLSEYKISVATANKLIERGLVRVKKKLCTRNSYALSIAAKIPQRVLTPEQAIAVKAIEESLDQSKFLLFGITGSGKTQVYIELTKLYLQQHRQVLILVPEIVLTGQLVKSLQEYFTNKVAVIHSRLTINERNDTFRRIRHGEAQIIIGARSAIFAPFKDLGLIVMDEEHDPSYKQDESPRYHAHDIVEEMSRIYNAKLLFASATPRLESYYLAKQGVYSLLTMMHRVDNIPLPEIIPIDMREELRYGNRKIMSAALQELIKSTIEQHQQVIIMLNRRGFSTFVMCRSCGYVAKCSECGMPMVYHRRGVLQCHHCDITAPVPDICPECESRYIKFFGSGTEKLEEELRTLFPEAKTLRLDRDTTGKKFAHQEILDQFKSGDYQILLGTQMVAKGHDIPNVTAVGIISADASLNLPDFRSGERCFGLITQTAGRAGRGKIKGKVIVQTYSTEHYAIECGIKQDYEAFYNAELPLRQLMKFPPFTSLIKLVSTNENEAKALQQAKDIKTAFLNHFKDNTTVSIMGPAPAIIANLRGTYRFNLLLKAENIADLQDFIRQQQIHINNRIIIDVNPINTN